MSFDPNELDDLMREMRASTGAVRDMVGSLERDRRDARGGARSTIGRDLEGAGKGAKTFGQRLTSASGRVSDSFSVLSADTEVASERLRQFSKNIPGAALLGSFVAWSRDAIDTWRDMSDIGQTFSGSIFDMAAAAADAGLPLDQFARAVRNSSKTVAIFGTKHVTGLMKNVREASEAQGLYGYTIDGLNDVTGKYLEVQRLYGNRSAAENTRSIKSVGEFAKQVTAVAAATGTARDKIMEIVESAMTDVALTSRMVGRSGDDIQAFSDKAMQATAILAGLPGEAGSTFSTFLTQTLGYGTALFADAANDFVDAGMGSMLTSMSNLAQGIESNGGDIEGATWGMIEDFKGQVESNIEGLRIQAMAGNASAKRILQMHAEIKNLTQAEYERKKKEAEMVKPLTALLASFGNIFKRLMGSLVGGIFEKLGEVEAAMGSFVDSGIFRFMEEQFANWGRQIGSFLANIDVDEVKAWAGSIEGMIKFVIGATGAIAGFAGMVVQVANVFKSAIEMMMKPIEWVGNLFGEEFGNKVKGVSGMLATLATILGGFLIFKGIKSLLGNIFGQTMRANAIRVIGNTVMVGGGMGMGGLGDMGGRGRGRGGRAGRAGRAAGGMGRAAGRFGLFGAGAGLAAGVAGGGARAGGRALGGIAAKGVGKGLLKKIPGVSILAGLGFGAQRAMGGDWLGAGGEVLSGLLGTIPGLGTAASVGIDAALMGRDMGAFGGQRGRGGARPRGGRGRWGALGMGALGLGAAGVAGVGIGNMLGLPGALGSFFGRRDDPAAGVAAATSAVERSAAEARTSQNDTRQAQMEQTFKQMKEMNEQLLATNVRMLNILTQQLTVSKALLNQQQ
jgi:hypothetical protein